MIIRPLTNYNSMSFKAIRLNESEQKRSDNLMNRLKVVPEQETDTIKFQLYELYDKHIQKEVNEKCRSFHIKEDFAQEMFLKFFESLENIRKNILPVEEFIPFMNSIKPSKDELKSGVAEESIEKSYKSDTLTLKNILTSDNLPQCLSAKSNEEILYEKEKVEKLINKSNLREIENEVLKEKRSGKTLVNIANKLNLSKTSVYRHLHKSINKIQEKNGLLPKDIEDLILEFNEIYEINDIKKVTKSLISNPILLNRGKEHIYKNINRCATLLEIPEKEFARTGLKQPQLFYQKPETIKENIKKSAELLEIEEKDFIKSGLKQPEIFVMKASTLKKNITTLTNLLEIPEKELLKTISIQPQIYLMKPENLNNNVTEVAKILNVEKSEIVNLAKSYPAIFLLEPESTVKKIKLSQYYKQIKGKNSEKLSFSAASTDVFYEKALSYLIKKSFKNNSITPNNYTEYITANPNKTYKFELPKNELNEEFIQFVKNHFNEQIGKCNVEFVVNN